jgi:type III restriction enzyme
LQCYVRGEAERADSLGALYLTNVQQLYERPEGDSDEPDIMTAMLGPKPPARGLNDVEDFASCILKRGGPVVVLHDETHHAHEENSEWNKCLRRLHAELITLRERSLPCLALLRSSISPPRRGTPRGKLFSWTIFDYPLKQAILDNIVKRPLKVIAKGIAERPSDIASTRYQAYLAAGLRGHAFFTPPCLSPGEGSGVGKKAWESNGPLDRNRGLR